jgi:hypothetical protein
MYNRKMHAHGQDGCYGESKLAKEEREGAI